MPVNSCDSMGKKATSNADGNKAVQTQRPDPLNNTTKSTDQPLHDQLPNGRNGSALQPVQHTLRDNPVNIRKKLNVISENDERVELGQLKTADNIVGLCKKVKLFKPSLNFAENNLSTPESPYSLLNSNTKCSPLAHQKQTPSLVINGESLENKRSTNTDFDEGETTKNNLSDSKAKEVTNDENVNSSPKVSKEVDGGIRQPNDQNDPTEIRNKNKRIKNFNTKVTRSPKPSTDLSRTTTTSHHVKSLLFTNTNGEREKNETPINVKNTKSKRNVKKASGNPPEKSLQSSRAKPNKGSTRGRNSKKVDTIKQNITNSKPSSVQTDHGMLLRSKKKSSRLNMKSNESMYGPTTKEKGGGRKSTINCLNLSVAFNEDLPVTNCDKSATKRKLFSLNTGENLLEASHATGSRNTENLFLTSAVETEEKLTSFQNPVNDNSLCNRPAPVQNLELHKETVRPHAQYNISKNSTQKVSRWEIKFQQRSAKSRGKLHQSAKTIANVKSVYSDLDSDIDHGIYDYTNKDREFESSTKKDVYEMISESEFENVRLRSTVSQIKTERKQQVKGSGLQKKGNGSKGAQAEKKSFFSLWGDREERPDILRCGTEMADRRENVENLMRFVNETYFPKKNGSSKNESFPPLIVEYEDDKRGKHQTVLSSTLDSDLSKDWSGYETGDKGIIALSKDTCNNTTYKAKPKQSESNIEPSITKSSHALNFSPTGNSVMVNNKLGQAVTELQGNKDSMKSNIQMTKIMKGNMSKTHISGVTESTSALQQFDSPVITNAKEESNNLQRKTEENSVSSLAKRNGINCDSAIDDTHLPINSSPFNNQAEIAKSVPDRKLIRNNNDNTSRGKGKEQPNSQESVSGLHNDSLDHIAKEKCVNTSDKFEIIQMTSHSSELPANDHPEVQDASIKNSVTNPEVQKSDRMKVRDKSLDLNSDEDHKTKGSSQNVLKNKENILYGVDKEKITENYDLERESIIEIIHNDTGTRAEKRLKKKSAEVGKKELSEVKNKNKIQREDNIITEMSDRITSCTTEMNHAPDGGSEEILKELLKDKNFDSKSTNKLQKNRKVQNKKKPIEKDLSDQNDKETDLQNHSSKYIISETNENGKSNEMIENLALNTKKHTTVKKTSKPPYQNDKSEMKEEGYQMDDHIDKYFTEQEFEDTYAQTCSVVAPLKSSHKESRNCKVIDNIPLDTQDKLFLAERIEQTKPKCNYISKLSQELADDIYKNNGKEMDFSDDNTDIIPCSREQLGSSASICRKNMISQNGMGKSRERSFILPTSMHNKNSVSTDTCLNKKKANNLTEDQHSAETAGEEFVNSDEGSIGSMINPPCPSQNIKTHKNLSIGNMQAVEFVDRIKSKKHDHGLETYNVENNLRCPEKLSVNDTAKFGKNRNDSKFTSEKSHLTLDMSSDKQTLESDLSKISHILMSDKDELENICKPTDKQFVISNVEIKSGISLNTQCINNDVIDCDSRENTISQFQKKRDKCKRKLVWSEPANLKKDLKNTEKDVCKRRKMSAEVSYSSADSFLNMFSDSENNEERNSLKKPLKKYNSSPLKTMRRQGEKRKCSESRLQLNSARRNIHKTVPFKQAAASSEKTLHFAEGNQPRSSLLPLQTMLSEGLKLKLKCLQSFSQKALEATVLDFKNCCIEDQNIRKLKMNGNLQDIAKMTEVIEANVRKSEELGEKMLKMYQYAKGIATHNEKWIKSIEEGLHQLQQKEGKFRNLMEEHKENMEQQLCSQSKLHHTIHNIMRLQLQYETKNVMARVKARFFSLLQRE